MRILGFLFVVLLVLAVAGYFRGWFAISTVRATDKNDVTVQIDERKVRDDANAAGIQLGQLSAKAVAAVKALANKVSAEESALDGTLQTVDQAARDLTLSAGSETIGLHVPTGIPISRDGKAVEFVQLQPDTRVRITFRHVGEDRTLARIGILP